MQNIGTLECATINNANVVTVQSSEVAANVATLIVVFYDLL
jgi:hypothetical protein